MSRIAPPLRLLLLLAIQSTIEKLTLAQAGVPRIVGYVPAQIFILLYIANQMIKRLLLPKVARIPVCRLI